MSSPSTRVLLLFFSSCLQPPATLRIANEIKIRKLWIRPNIRACLPAALEVLHRRALLRIGTLSCNPYQLAQFVPQTP